MWKTLTWGLSKSGQRQQQTLVIWTSHRQLFAGKSFMPRTTQQQDSTRSAGKRAPCIRASFHSQALSLYLSINTLRSRTPDTSHCRYLLLEFPILTDPNIQHVAEIGCGAGSSLLPILKANPCCRATGTDLSPTAIRMLKQAAETAGIAQDRITAFSFDSTRIESLPHPLHGMTT